MQQVQYNKTCITLKHNLRIDWKFGHERILSISTKQCHKRSISKSQNGPLKLRLIIHSNNQDFLHILVQNLLLCYISIK